VRAAVINFESAGPKHKKCEHPAANLGYCTVTHHCPPTTAHPPLPTHHCPPTTAHPPRPKECAHPGARAKLARLGALAQRGAADTQFLAMLRSLDDSHTALEHKWAAMARHVAREADFRCGSLRCLLQRFATQTWTGGKAEGCCCRAHDGTITCRVTGALWRCLLTLCIYTLLCTAFKGVSALLQRIWHMP